MITNVEMKKFVEKFTTDKKFVEELRADPEQTLRNEGIPIDEETKILIRDINWKAKDLGLELQQRMSKAGLSINILPKPTGGGPRM